MIKVLIADDEPLALASVRYSIEQFTNWQVVATADNGVEALKGINQYQPDVVLLDINMPLLSGMELSQHLKALKTPPLIVFITAYDNFAVDAFANCAFDYLLKPYDDERFRFMTQRVEMQLAGDAHKAAGEVTFLVKSIGKMQVVRSSEIDWLESAGNYVAIHTNEQEVLHRISLNQMAEQLPDNFVRIHRKYIICVEQAQQLQTDGAGHTEVLLLNGITLPVSDSYKSGLLDALQ